MTLAKRVKDTIEERCPGTFSLYAGYGVQGGQSVYYPTGALIRERRNDKGRCTYALYQYADGSKLEFTYRENSGYALKEK